VRLDELRSPEGARRPSRRVGRGTGSGHGKTSGRGTKGQHHRGEGFRLGFEGGQMPFAQRIPKLGGFKNPFKRTYALVNLTRLGRFPEGAQVGPEQLVEAGLAEPGMEIKVLGAGKLRRRLQVTAHAFSQSARAAIEKRGGTVTLIGGEKAPKSEKKARGRAAAVAGAAEAAAEAAPEPAEEPSEAPEA